MKISQNDIIKEALQRGWHSNLELMQLCGTTAPATRISEVRHQLRGSGFGIDARERVSKNGRKHLEYRIRSEPTGE